MGHVYHRRTRSADIRGMASTVGHIVILTEVNVVDTDELFDYMGAGVILALCVVLFPFTIIGYIAARLERR